MACTDQTVQGLLSGSINELNDSLKMQHQTIENTLELTGHVVYADTMEQLIDIHLPYINLALYPREVPQQLNDFIIGLDLDKFPSIHGNLNCHEIHTLLKSSLRNITTDIEGLNLFIEDIKIISEHFSAITGTKFIRFNLYTVESNLCKYFHADYNNLRLLCTYRGEGTQWLLNEDATSSSGRRLDNIIDRDRIQRFETFWVGVLKGEAYKNNKGNGIIHRSPPVGKKSAKQILLKLDA